MIVKVKKNKRFLNMLSVATILVGVPLAIYEFDRLTANTNDVSHLINFATGLGSVSAVILAINDLLNDNYHENIVKGNEDKILQVLKILP